MAYESAKCHDCKVPIVYENGVSAEAQVTICWRCAEKRRKKEALRPDYQAFTRESKPFMVDGKIAAIATLRAFD